MADFDSAAFDRFRRRPDMIAMADRILAGAQPPACDCCGGCGEVLELDGRCLYCSAAVEVRS